MTNPIITEGQRLLEAYEAEPDFIAQSADDPELDLAEFFILHTYRCSGVGSHVATAIFDSFPGSWEIIYHSKNISSVRFWHKVVSEYAGGDYEERLSCPELQYHDGTLGDMVSFSKRNISGPTA